MAFVVLLPRPARAGVIPARPLIDLHGFLLDRASSISPQSPRIRPERWGSPTRTSVPAAELPHEPRDGPAGEYNRGNVDNNLGAPQSRQRKDPQNAKRREHQADEWRDHHEEVALEEVQFKHRRGDKRTDGRQREDEERETEERVGDEEAVLVGFASATDPRGTGSEGRNEDRRREHDQRVAVCPKIRLCDGLVERQAVPSKNRALNSSVGMRHESDERCR